MIEIQYNPRARAVLISGHANSGEVGEDIVCAGVSTLVHTLHESLSRASNMLETLDHKIAEGDSVIRCIPKEGYEGHIDLILWTILNGLELIAKKCPEHVKFAVFDPMDTASVRGEK